MRSFRCSTREVEIWFGSANRHFPNLNTDLTSDGMTFTTAIGLLAATCTTVSYIPQVLKAWHTRSTADISFGMFLLLNIGVGFWLAYGVMLGDAPLILANFVTLCLVGAILVFKLRFG
jgi:MtN3 and saliva related transmembrane protein